MGEHFLTNLKEFPQIEQKRMKTVSCYPLSR